VQKNETHPMAFIDHGALDTNEGQTQQKGTTKTRSITHPFEQCCSNRLGPIGIDGIRAQSSTFARILLFPGEKRKLLHMLCCFLMESFSCDTNSQICGTTRFSSLLEWRQPCSVPCIATYLSLLRQRRFEHATYNAIFLDNGSTIKLSIHRSRLM
jgi:hypothetical protein